MSTINIDILEKVQPIDVSLEESSSTLDTGIETGGGGIKNHAILSNRDASDQHPISAITDLESTLADKLSQADLQKGIDAALAQAKASGEFDGKDGADGKNGTNGKDGVDGKDGAQGEKGADGYTPVKGTDYWTDADKAEIVKDTEEAIDLSSYAEKTDLEKYLPLTGGNCTGVITAPTAAEGTSTTQIATTEFVQVAILKALANLDASEVSY